jgi:hypothetical protein
MHHLYEIRAAYKPPPNSGPVEGGGTWIANKPNGYYMGFAKEGSHFELAFTSRRGWHFGRIIYTVNLCGWIVPDAIHLKHPVHKVKPTCSASDRYLFWDRSTFGEEFNHGPGGEGDGTKVEVTDTCSFYRNYFHGNHLHPHKSGLVTHLHRQSLEHSKVHYRFSTKTGNAAVARVAMAGLGWGFIVPVSSIVWPSRK